MAKRLYNLGIIGTSLVFIGLNIADAWLTKQLLDIGCGEANPLVTTYGSIVWFKGLLALAIIILLVGLGKARVLRVLNICMLTVVLWNTGWLLYLE